MNWSGKNTGIMTPTKDPQSSRSKISEISKFTENFNPNLSNGSPLQKPRNSPAIKSEKSKKSAPKSLNQIASPRIKIPERKFVVVKRSSKTAASTDTCKCKEKMGGGNLKKCPCIAYENLRASQEEFFRNRSSIEDTRDESKNSARAESKEKEKNPIIENMGTVYGSERKSMESNRSSTNEQSNQYPEENKLSSEMGSSKIKRRRDKLLEEARNSIPEAGSGRVLHLVKAFERILSLPSSKDSKGEEEEESEKIQKGLNWALPGLQTRVPETQISSSSFCPSELVFNSMDSRVSLSLDCSQGRTSGGGRRSRRNSSESSGTFGGRNWKKKQLKVTKQQPFKLRTEQRGRFKEEVFFKKVHEMIMEEERQRIPVAQGLPWTTDEPEFLVKPTVKESTKPIDLKLHSDLRAVERAEFDHHVAEKLSLIEQYRMERERQQKLAEEEEIKRLRRGELIPKAQPMPYFDRPFIPKRSLKHPTIPREPKFHIPHHKKKCMSWNDFNIYTHQH
ncbi:hypothetical protein HHK36_007332 [Tetracentron sinense]|uniref:TPX2 C-terminal domain-containing protein n=1 Tax=Tetracentron sinense TaxID=13715 RepID=A0A834ZMF2_TETSI|nr:hypothetical protein HHK36_007332 [Tetracentron sinense]